VIIRIMSEGQFVVDEALVAELNALDDQLEECFEKDDETAFERVRDAMLTLVRARGKPLDVADLSPSDVVLPPQDATIEEVRALLGEKGLVPG